MIQEIYDYLWIRQFLICMDVDLEIEDIRKEVENGINKSYKDIVSGIARIMENEEFLLTSDELLKDATKLVNEFRFDYNKDKEINDKVNYIIERLNDYNKMSDKRKKYLTKNFYEKEYKDRKLPFIYHNNHEYLDYYLSLDAENFVEAFINIFKNGNYQVNDVMAFTSTINFLMTRYKEFFMEYEAEEVLLPFFNQVIEAVADLPKKDTKKKTIIISMHYLKQTLNRLNKLIAEKQVREKEKIKD